MQKLPVVGLGGLLLTGLVACDAGKESPEPIGKPNPAAVHCVGQGGTYDLETGICTTADGEEVDGWEYLRQSEGS